jgi:TetR/AcrR family transcriptional repressor of lmrAB and yxaGH operons
MTLVKGEQSKQHLIETAANLFLQKGYSNTGINDILKEAYMSKGSFYFYFSSKKELGFEVSKYYGKKILSEWLEPLSKNPWDVFVTTMVSDIKKSVSESNYYGCPLAVLGLDISFVEADLLNTYAAGIEKVIGVFSNSLQLSGLTKEISDMTAKKAFALYEGNVIYYKISKDEEIFNRIQQDLLSLL